MLWNRKSDRKRIVYRAFCLLAWWISWWTCLAFHSISLTLFIRYYFPRNKGFSSASQPSSSSTTVSKPWRGNNFIEKRAQKARIFLTSCMHPLQKCGLCSCYFSLSLILLVRTLTYCPWLWIGIRLVQRVFGWGFWLNPKSGKLNFHHWSVVIPYIKVLAMTWNNIPLTAFFLPFRFHPLSHYTSVQSAFNDFLGQCTHTHKCLDVKKLSVLTMSHDTCAV